MKQVCCVGCADLAKERDEALIWVRRLEFVTDSKHHNFCDVCGEDDRHAPECDLDAFLTRVGR